jgi:DNA repair exonuclease SbcCD ATPase subunit
MGQDVALISGFMSAIKSFLEEMKIGGLKRLGTEFGTFIREESEQLTATIITSDIKIEEELWIRNKLHEFLVKIEQSHYEQLKDWKGDVAQFRESFPVILASLINLEKVQSLQRQKIERLTRNKHKLQEKVNKYGAKLEELKSRYDSGEIDFKKYIIERYKTEAKYDKFQKEYLYVGLFLSRAPALLEAKPMKTKEAEKIEKIQNQLLEIRREIEELQKKELEGSITSQDLERKESLQKELMTLMEKLDKLKKT